MRTPQYWVVLVLLALTGIVMYRRGDTDKVPASTPLNHLPQSIGGLEGQDVPIAQEALAVLGKGFFLNRLYIPASTTNAQVTESKPVVGLFIGYFPTQRTGQAIHSPQHCLPGAGWVFDSSGVTEITGPDGATERVGDYIISNGPQKAEVLYWYQSHGRVIANDYKAKLYTLVDSIRLSRTDAALVRIVVPVNDGEPLGAAHGRAVAFARNLIPLLPAFVPN